MASPPSDEKEFKIKGAASNKSSSSPPASISDKTDDQRDDASVNVKTPVAEAEEGNQTASKGKGKKTEPDEQDLKAKYRWYKCEAVDPASGEKVEWFVHKDTEESRWDEPNESFWLFDTETQDADVAAGLQQTLKARAKAKGIDLPDGYGGYVPQIHGPYDAKASYVKWHERKAEAEAAAAAEQTRAALPGAATYESTMTLNRFTGHAQRSGLGPERHSDSAKASRQMNAFFDPDAAANSHDGRSLKEERKGQYQTRKQIQEHKRVNKQKKEAKRRAKFLN